MLDAADFAGVSDVVASAAADGVEFLGLVAAAGIFVIEDFLDTGPEDWRHSIEVNLIGTMSATRAVVPHIRDAGGGSIVTITSTAGESGSARPAAAYAASKAGVIGFTKSVARELAPAGIRANTISPGPLDTPMLQIGSKQRREEIEARTLVGRLGRPEDIANAAAFLISEESSFITGEVLRVNGGSLL